MQKIKNCAVTEFIHLIENFVVTSALTESGSGGAGNGMDMSALAGMLGGSYVLVFVKCLQKAILASL